MRTTREKFLRSRAAYRGQMELPSQSRNPKIKACLGSLDFGLRDHWDLNLSATVRTTTRIRKDLIVTVSTTHTGHTLQSIGLSVTACTS